MNNKFKRDISLAKRIMAVCFIIVFDIISFAVSYFMVMPVFKMVRPESGMYYFNFVICTVCPVIFLFIFGAYKFKNLKNFFRLIYLSAVSLILSFVFNLCLDLLLYKYYTLRYLVYYFVISFVCVISLRLIYFFSYHFYRRFIRKKDELKPTMIIGAGFTGRMVFNELYNHSSELVPTCFVDDDIDLISTNILGVKVFGPAVLIPEICKKNNIKTIILAIPSCDASERDKILKFCSETGCEIRVVPSADQLLQKKPLLMQASTIDVNDLIGVDSALQNDEDIINFVSNKVCLITGAGGSIGSELCRQVVNAGAKKTVILDMYENSAFSIQQELLLSGIEQEKISVEIVSVRDYEKLEEIFICNNFDIVIHSAAHKHVPLMENSPEEAVKNNCIGTYNVAKLCDKYNINKMISISTDKAHNPTNVMGASKRVAEIILEEFSKNSKCDFVSIRFGNVLGSNGSVIELFLKQIDKGGPLTVTHPEILRYFMTIPEAVSLVLKAATFKTKHEVYVLDMGKPVKILTLAENLIRMCGFEPYQDIDIIFSGLRPGEKLQEENNTEDKYTPTKDKKIFICNTENTVENTTALLADLFSAAKANKSQEVLKIFNMLIPEYDIPV